MNNSVQKLLWNSELPLSFDYRLVTKNGHDSLCSLSSWYQLSYNYEKSKCFDVSLKMNLPVVILVVVLFSQGSFSLTPPFKQEIKEFNLWMVGF